LTLNNQNSELGVSEKIIIINLRHQPVMIITHHQHDHPAWPPNRKHNYRKSDTYLFKPKIKKYSHKCFDTQNMWIKFDRHVLLRGVR